MVAHESTSFTKYFFEMQVINEVSREKRGLELTISSIIITIRICVCLIKYIQQNDIVGNSLIRIIILL